MDKKKVCVFRGWRVDASLLAPPPVSPERAAQTLELVQQVRTGGVQQPGALPQVHPNGAGGHK